MKEYELFYLIGETKKGEFRTINADVQAIITTHGGTWLPKQVTEERRLAYPIKHERRGMYVAQRFTLPDRDAREESEVSWNNPIPAMNRALSLHAGVLRALIIDAAELPPLQTKEERDADRIAKEQAREIAEAQKTPNTDMDKQVEEALHL